VAVDPRDILTRPAPGPDFTVAYGDDPEQIADVRLPPAGGPVRAPVLYVHGGFWRARWDRTHCAPLAAALAALGHPVVSVEYRRVGQPGGGWPGTFDDVATAAVEAPELVATAVAERGGVAPDMTRPVLVGHSAGGQLVLWLAARLGPADTRGVVALAPVADLVGAYERGLGDDAVAALLGGGPLDVPDRYAAVDPKSNTPIGVPVVVIHGDRDVPVPIAVGESFVAAATARGDDVRMVRLAGADHYAVIDPLSSAWPQVRSAIAEIGGAAD
jgi:acetyl esterase/lipase